MGSDPTYKIKISPDRVLGPLDRARVEALVMKGAVSGNEPTSVAPYTNWSPLREHPELLDLLKRKLAKQGGGTSAVTMSMTGAPDAPDASFDPDAAESLEGSLSMPTLVNIPVGDLRGGDDRTRLDLPATLVDDGDKTKIITTEQFEPIWKKYEEVAPSVPGDDAAPGGTAIAAKPGVKKALLHKRTFWVLAIGLLVYVLFTNFDEGSGGGQERPLKPRWFTFPYIEVNVPTPYAPDAILSDNLLEQGLDLAAAETPAGIIKAIRTGFYPAVRRNPKGIQARASLASAYMRIAEIVPRDERFYNTLKTLLSLKPPKGKVIPEYSAALSEFYFLINRTDQAEEVLDEAMKSRPSAEVQYLRALAHQRRGKTDAALALMSRMISATVSAKMNPNPRHDLFYADLLDKRGQSALAEQILRRVNENYPNFAPVRLLRAEQLLRKGNHAAALKTIRWVTERPHLLDRPTLARTFLLVAKILEGMKTADPRKRIERAVHFAEAAKNVHVFSDEMSDLIYRLKTLHPKTADAYKSVVSGRQRERLREYDNAMIDYLRAADEREDDPTPQYLIARLLEQQGKTLEAMNRYLRSADTAKKPIEPLIRLARIYIDRYDLENAKTTIQRAVALRRNRSEVEILKGFYQYRQGRKDLGEFTLKSALALGGRNSELYVFLGKIEEDRKNYGLAEFYYSMALRYDRENAEALLGLANTRFYSESPSRAISYLKDRLNEQPNSAPIMTSLSVIYYKSGDQASAKSYIINAIRADKTYAPAFKLLGNLMRADGDANTSDFINRRNNYRQALAAYEQYTALSPNDAEGYKATADLYYQIRDLGAAAKNYHQVIKLVPNYPDVRVRLAKISRNGGDVRQAIEFLEEELKNHPESDAAHTERGHIYNDEGKLDLALSSYTQAVQLNESNTEALLTLGNVHQKMGNYDHALSLYDRVIKIDPLISRAHWLMGTIYRRRGDRLKAIQSFKNVLALSGDPELKKGAQDAIKELDEALHKD
ncbi:MAG: tetratricopeptide repeat protein [Bdellovibrionales bacterium]|nr:tetratricopeptide repeat protein [Bdellovibrionales bacterium]